jgi:hypothetical protein
VFCFHGPFAWFERGIANTTQVVYSLFQAPTVYRKEENDADREWHQCSTLSPSLGFPVGSLYLPNFAHLVAYILSDICLLYENIGSLWEAPLLLVHRLLPETGTVRGSDC